MTTMHTNMNRPAGTARVETSTLIASDKVEGTAAYGADKKKIGSIENLMINKRSGQVAYAVLSFGGFLGVATDHYPLPWSMLHYDEELGGYLVNVTKEQLKAAPKYGAAELWNWSDVQKDREIESYYRIM